MLYISAQEIYLYVTLRSLSLVTSIVCKKLLVSGCLSKQTGSVTGGPRTSQKGLHHRNLSGEDYTDCSFISLHILCTISTKQNIQKLFGFAPSRAASKQEGGIFETTPAQFK
uniref:Uncharacterized protein n=1 Tax=Glossina brevipalpis TaxID=37001 RepID=A0A1A9WNK6_9MUSC